MIRRCRHSAAEGNVYCLIACRLMSASHKRLPTVVRPDRQTPEHPSQEATTAGGSFPMLLRVNAVSVSRSHNHLSMNLVAEGDRAKVVFVDSPHKPKRLRLVRPECMQSDLAPGIPPPNFRPASGFDPRAVAIRNASKALGGKMDPSVITPTLRVTKFVAVDSGTTMGSSTTPQAPATGDDHSSTHDFAPPQIMNQQGEAWMSRRRPSSAAQRESLTAVSAEAKPLLESLQLVADVLDTQLSAYAQVVPKQAATASASSHVPPLTKTDGDAPPLMRPTSATSRPKSTGPGAPVRHVLPHNAVNALDAWGMNLPLERNAVEFQRSAAGTPLGKRLPVLRPESR
jgi:hypothetical protein